MALHNRSITATIRVVDHTEFTVMDFNLCNRGKMGEEAHINPLSDMLVVSVALTTMWSKTRTSINARAAFSRFVRV